MVMNWRDRVGGEGKERNYRLKKKKEKEIDDSQIPDREGLEVFDS